MSKHDMVFQVTTSADRATVRRALTTEEGIKGWWTGDATLKGDALRPSFPGMDQPFELAVTTDSPDRLVWTVGSFPPPWLGTRCEWDLSDGPDGSGTRIDMAHRDFDRSNPAIGYVTMEWARILDHLVRYVETGRPDPRTPAKA